MSRKKLVLLLTALDIIDGLVAYFFLVALQLIYVLSYDS